MAYTERITADPSTLKRTHQLSVRDEIDRPESYDRFYEIEPAIVTHVILDNKDSYIPKINDAEPIKDWSYVGRIQCRPIYSHNKSPTSNLPFAIPLDRNVREYPLVNELVLVIRVLGQYYYWRKTNIFHHMNSNFDPRWNTVAYGQKKIKASSKRSNISQASVGATNSTAGGGGGGGNAYFGENPDVHPLIPYEGDLMLESRFGSTIRMGGYNVGEKNGFSGEHPYIWIRNRENDDDFNGVENAKPIDEDVNKDGTTIQILSRDIQSRYKKTVDVDIARSLGKPFPTILDGDQVILNTDRIVLSTRNKEIYVFGKESISFGTDGVFSVDSQDDIHFETNRNFELKDVQMRVDSQIIYLGEPDNRSEPLVLGTQLVNWLTQLTSTLMAETHPTMTGPTGPPIQAPQYANLQAQLFRILSRRNFGV